MSAASPDFPWLEPTAPRAGGAAARRGATSAGIAERAALLHRLGRDHAFALRRCRANLAWDHEFGAAAPIDDAELVKLVDVVFGTG